MGVDVFLISFLCRDTILLLLHLKLSALYVQWNAEYRYLYQHTSALALCVSSGILETCTRYIHIRPSSSNSSLYSVKNRT